MTVMASVYQFLIPTLILVTGTVSGLPQDFVTISGKPLNNDDAQSFINVTHRSVINDAAPSLETPCFENLCTCRNTTADCSRNNGNLTFVPRLPDDITFLDFSYNKLHTIRDNFFLNVTNITGIDLSHNGMTGISAGAFGAFTRLETVILNYNHRLTYDTLKPVFSIPTLKRLELVHDKLGPLPTDLFVRFPLAALEELNLRENGIQNSISGFELGIFSPLHKLRVLILAGNSFLGVVPAVLPTLETLDLSNTGFDSFPPTCDGNGSFFPSLTSLDARSGLQSPVPSHVCLPRLQVLRVSPGDIHTHTFIKGRFPSLRELYVKVFGGSLDKDAFANEGLELISLEGNTGLTSIDDHVFRGCSSLSTLIFAVSTLDYVSSGKIQEMLRPLQNLKRLAVESFRIKDFSKHTFSFLKSLTMLSLQGDLIENIPDGAFDVFLNLTHLDLSNNLISSIGETTFGPHLMQNLRHLDLSGNSFDCDCSVMWLRNRLLSDPRLFSNARSNYTCSLGFSLTNKMDIASFYLNPQACLLSEVTYRLITALSAMAIGTFLLFLIFCRCRRTLKPMLYDIFRGPGNLGREHLRQADYQYDVFVSYAAEDLPWVRAHLMPELEDRLGLRLCLHDRDFRPGREIMGNITACLEVSRKVMVVFSRDFARSPWCQWELTLCLTHVMDNADNMLVVYLHEIPPRELTNNMLAVMRTCTYLQWAEDQETRRRFWTRLLDSLRGVVQQARQRRH